MIEHSGKNRAYYDLRRDRVVLPHREQFPDAPAYYQTALHEMGHWTGHPDRLNRPTLVKGIEDGFASPSYAREELRAEICSMMTCARLNLNHDPSRHAAYVGSWIQALRDDPREIYRAARDAQEMSDYVLGHRRDRAPDRPPEAEQAASSPEPAPPPRATEPAPPRNPSEQLRLFQRPPPPSLAQQAAAAVEATRPHPLEEPLAPRRYAGIHAARPPRQESPPRDGVTAAAAQPDRRRPGGLVAQARAAVEEEHGRERERLQHRPGLAEQAREALDRGRDTPARGR